MAFSDNIDKHFFTMWPFGVLKTIHWLAPLAILITIWLGPYTYHSMGFVIFTAWNAFIISLVTWICYLFGLQQKRFQFSGGIIVIPFALIDFLVALLAILFFGISSLICLIAFVDSIGYKFAHVFTYLFATIFSLISGAAFAYFAILVYRSIPNGQFRNLTTLVIEGNQITTMEEHGGGVGMPGRPPV